MSRKRIVSGIVVLAGLALAATCGLALAHGSHGWSGHGADREMWPAARAAGLSPTQIAAAFHNDTNLRTDFSKVRTTHDAMVGCVVKGGTCSNEISAYASAQQGLTTEKMGVWLGLFSKAPNPSNGAAVLAKLQNLRQAKRQILQGVFGDGPKPQP